MSSHPDRTVAELRQGPPHGSARHHAFPECLAPFPPPALDMGQPSVHLQHVKHHCQVTCDRRVAAVLTCGLGRVAYRRDVCHNRLIYHDKIMLRLGRGRFRENPHIQHTLSSTTAQTALSARHASPPGLRPRLCHRLRDNDPDRRGIVVVHRIVDLGTVGDHRQHVHFGAQVDIVTRLGYARPHVHGSI